MGTEAPGFHPAGRNSPAFGHQAVKCRFRFGRRGGGTEARTQAGSSIGGQGELADQEQISGDIVEGSIHLAGIVVENPVTQQPLGHLLDLALTVPRLGGDQRQQARADGANSFALHFDLGLGDALNEGKHGRI